MCVCVCVVFVNESCERGKEGKGSPLCPRLGSNVTFAQRPSQGAEGRRGCADPANRGRPRDPQREQATWPGRPGNARASASLRGRMRWAGNLCSSGPAEGGWDQVGAGWRPGKAKAGGVGRLGSEGHRSVCLPFPLSRRGMLPWPSPRWDRGKEQAPKEQGSSPCSGPGKDWNLGEEAVGGPGTPPQDR